MALKVAFLGEAHSELRGAEDMLQALSDLFVSQDMMHVLQEKLVGLTIDGEAANTGSKSGLRKKLKDKLGHGFLTLWCTAHRSDLALEEELETVAEFRHWKADSTGIASFHGASHYREKGLEKAATLIDAAFTYKTPKYHEVRFAEHLLKLVRAVQSNLPSLRRHCRDVLDHPDSEKKEKHQVSGFLKAWGRNSLNQRMTALMTDILRQFETLQKESQRSLITFPDLLVTREQVLAHLDMMETKPFPGGKED